MASKLNPANAVTASRYFTLPLFAMFLERGMYQWALVMVIINGVFDKLDGLVAKIFDCKTEFGSVFDAITDGICYGFILIALVAYERVPLIATALIVGLGALNVLFRVLYARRVGGAVNYQSHAMERLVGYTVYICAFGTVGYEVEFFFTCCAAVMVIVILRDAKRMLIDPVPA